MGDSGGSRVTSTLSSLSSNVLRVSNLAFILANIVAICWESIRVVWDLLDSPNKLGDHYEWECTTQNLNENETMQI